jgi:3-hydroxyacyl-CoA dehydrogenase/enoyl-CoA hydratase/3-hydroxybutyryl-CoA epimerase
MVAEGVPIERIDRTATAWGFPVGPIALLDEIGLDVAHKAAETMRAAFGERMKGGNTMDRMLAAGRLGRKNGRGFYRYRKGRKAGPDGAVHGVLGTRPAEDVAGELIERRLVYAMLNEAAMACAESVIRSARDGDIGAIYGIGFPPFRGGPLRLIDDLGASRVVSTLHELEDQFGERFRPAPALAEMARQGARYYPI